MNRFLSTVAVGAAMLAASAANAGTFNWSYTGAGVSASGTLTTAGAALVPEDILSITGQRNGLSILGLVPLDTNPNFIYDNQFSFLDPHFSEPGMLFDVGGGDTGQINVYVTGGVMFDLIVVDGAPIEVPITFSVTAVPEAATYAYMALGLAALGVAARRRKTA